eukprot:4743414-Pleurochrysis_carterae.AAC.2
MRSTCESFAAYCTLRSSHRLSFAVATCRQALPDQSCGARPLLSPLSPSVAKQRHSVHERFFDDGRGTDVGMMRSEESGIACRGEEASCDWLILMSRARVAVAASRRMGI